MKDVLMTSARYVRVARKSDRALARLHRLERDCSASGEMSPEVLARTALYKELRAAWLASVARAKAAHELLCEQNGGLPF